MQRNGGVGSVAAVSPLLLAKHPTENLFPPRINPSAPYTFAPIFHKLRIWGKSFKEKMLLYCRGIKNKTERFHGTLCLCPSQVGNPSSILHIQLSLTAMLHTRWIRPRCPQQVPRALLT